MNTTENKAVIHGKHSNVEDFVVPPDVDNMPDNVENWLRKESYCRDMIP